MAIDLQGQFILTSSTFGYAVEDEAINGGFRIVSTARQVVTETRLNELIFFGRRKRGMVVYDNTTGEMWQCTNPGTGASDGQWSPFTFPVNDVNGGTY